MWILPSRLLSCFALMSTIVAQNQIHDHDHSKCGTRDPTAEEVSKDVERMNKYKARRRSRSQARSLCVGCVVIDVIFHVLEDEGRQSHAIRFLTDDGIDEQMKVLNEHYALTPFRFAHRETVRTTNDEWTFERTFNQDLSKTIAAGLRKGGADVANLFYTDGTCLDAGGFAAMPFEYGMFPKDTYSKYDFLFLCPWTISAGGNSHGSTLTHEMGHWLGLHHTFRGSSCDSNNDNDLVDDTPQQASYTQGCPTERNSCPNQPGLDPAHNYMDYTDPRCQTEFSAGQMERMYSQFNEYRRRIEPCGPDESDVRLEVQFDSKPDEVDVGFVVWSQEVGTQYGLKGHDEEHIDFANKLVTRNLCLPKQVLHEIYIEDYGGNGLQTPGFYSISMNGRQLATDATFTGERKSVFLYGGTLKCPAESSRMAIDFSFDSYPWHIFWEVRDATGNVVVDATDTYMPGADQYYTNYKKSFLSFEGCLPEGEYTFLIEDGPGDGIASPGYYALSFGGNVFRAGGGNSGFKDTESFPFEIVESDSFQAPPSSQAFCFSASSTVVVKGKGPVRMDELRIGDLVSVGNDKYEPVYGFGHRDPLIMADFLQLQCEQTTLSVSADHMIFVQDRGAIPASLVAIGDILLGKVNKELTVESIKRTVAQGVFAPFTPSGSIVVDDVLSSSFIAFEKSASLTIFGVAFSQQWLAHSFEFPHRLACHYLGKCSNEAYDANGVSHWVAIPLQVAQGVVGHSTFVRQLLFVPIVGIFGLFNLLEYILFRCNNPFALLATFQTVRVLRRFRRGSEKQPTE